MAVVHRSNKVQTYERVAKLLEGSGRASEVQVGAAIVEAQKLAAGPIYRQRDVLSSYLSGAVLANLVQPDIREDPWILRLPKNATPEQLTRLVYEGEERVRKVLGQIGTTLVSKDLMGGVMEPELLTPREVVIDPRDVFYVMLRDNRGVQRVSFDRVLNADYDQTEQPDLRRQMVVGRAGVRAYMREMSEMDDGTLRSFGWDGVRPVLEAGSVDQQRTYGDDMPPNVLYRLDS